MCELCLAFQLFQFLYQRAILIYLANSRLCTRNCVHSNCLRHPQVRQSIPSRGQACAVHSILSCRLLSTRNDDVCDVLSYIGYFHLIFLGQCRTVERSLFRDLKILSLKKKIRKGMKECKFLLEF